VLRNEVSTLYRNADEGLTIVNAYSWSSFQFRYRKELAVNDLSCGVMAHNYNGFIRCFWIDMRYILRLAGLKYLLLLIKWGKADLHMDNNLSAIDICNPKAFVQEDASLSGKGYQYNWE
jgi:hypothetical protein